MSEPVVETLGLGKLYGKRPGHRALSDLDLTVERGEIFGFLGPNGAGKSTAIRILLGLLKATEGSARVFGLDVWSQSTEVRSRLGYLPGEPRFREKQTGRQILRLFADLRQRSCDYDALAERLDLELDRSVRAYSKGMKQKLGLIQALMHDPELVILDEPTSGLDPFTQRTVNEMLRERRNAGATIFFSSHVLPEVEGLCDRVALLRSGRLLRCSTLAEFDELRRRRFELPFSDQATAQSALARVTEVSSSVQLIERCLVGRTQTVSDLITVINSAEGLELDGIKIEGLGLEDLFYESYGSSR